MNDSCHAVDVGETFGVDLRREFEVDGRWRTDSEWCDHAFLRHGFLRLEPSERTEAYDESDEFASDFSRWSGHWRWTVPVWRDDGTWEWVVCAEGRADGALEITPAQSVDIASDDRVSLRVLEVRSEARDVSDQFRPDFKVTVEIVNDSDFTLVLNPTSSMLWCEEDGLWLKHRFTGCGKTEMIYIPPHSTLRRRISGCGAGWFRVGLGFGGADEGVLAATEPFFVEHAGGIGRRVVRAEAAAAAPTESPR